MDVSIIGASGDCGQEIVAQLLDFRVLSPTERLQLVGRAKGRSARLLYGLRSDLMDAYAETAPELDVALHPEEIVADVIVMTAGATITAESKATSRNDLARVNLPIFHHYAQAIRDWGHGHEVVLIVTNPVELAVEVFSHYLGRRRVIGIGGYSDSLRFRRELANDIGVRRQSVQGFVVGEHGEAMVPLWSSVRIHSMDTEELQGTLTRLRAGRQIFQFPEEVSREKQVVIQYLKQQQIAEAFDYVDKLPPDIRVVIKPFVTQLSGAKTVAATANVTVDLVQSLLGGQEIVVAGQVQVQGEFYGIHTCIGVPIIVTPTGWSQVVPIELWEDEQQLLYQMSDRVKSKLQEWQHG